eukprot:5269484-Prorocentrum_lima.AAC.1
MTSSLVGSEMCIRDSALRQQVWQRLEVCWRRPVPRTLLRDVQTEEAVSYTHLTLPTICSV